MLKIILGYQNEYIPMLAFLLSVITVFIIQMKYLLKLKNISYNYCLFIILKILEFLFFKIDKFNYMFILPFLSLIPTIFYMVRKKITKKEILYLIIISFTSFLWAFLFLVFSILLMFIYTDF